MEDSRNIIKAIDALTQKAGGGVVDSKNITEAIDHLKEVYSQEAIGIDDTLTQEGLAADAKAVGDQIASLSSDMQSVTGGMAKRIADVVASGGTMTIRLNSSFSVNEGFALVNLNIAGNALAGCALLYLGRGSSKVGKIFGDMPEQYYSASYGSGDIWTITNNSESTMFITTIVSK